MGEVAAGVAVLLLTGVGYGAWTWLRRRLARCEEDLDACRERCPKHGEDWP